MIQRIQSLILVIALFVAITLFFVPVFHFSASTDGVTKDIYQLSVLKSYVVKEGTTSTLEYNRPLIIVNGLLCILYIVTILNYRKRLQQTKFCRFGLLLLAGLIALVLYDRDRLLTIAGADYSSTMHWTFLSLPLQLVLLYLAQRYILKDEALVRSSDRLR